MNRKTRVRVAWSFAAILFTSVSNSSQALTASQNLSDKYNATLEAAIAALRGGRTKEAYEITAELETLCEEGYPFEKDMACSLNHLKKIRGDFFYELSFGNASTLSQSGDHRGGIKIMEALEPSCVFLLSKKCVSEHEWLLAMM